MGVSFRIFVLASAVSCLYAFPSVAAQSSATASNADCADIDVASSSVAVRDDLSIEDELDLMEDYLEEAFDYDLEDTDTLILAYVRQIADSLSGPAVASPSSVSSSQDGLEDQENISVLPLDASSRAVLALPDHDVVYIRGTFGGDDYTLVIPADTYPYLWVADNNVLYNVSESSITGRLFPGTTFDSSDYEYRNLTMAPVLGSSANTLYRNQYLSYMTYYYQSRGYLTSDTTYGNFIVNEDGIEVQRSLQITYRSYYVSLVILFAVGVVILCLWKTYRR